MMAPSRVPDHIVTDLGRKAGEDVLTRIKQSAHLCAHPTDQFMIGLYGVASSIGLLAGFSEAVEALEGRQSTPDAHVDMIWSIVRPIVLKTLGGSGADFDALLAKARP